MIRRVSWFGVQSNLVKTNFKGPAKMVRLNESSSYYNPGNFRKRLIFVLFVSSWNL